MAPVRPVSTVLIVASACALLGGAVFGGYHFYRLLTQSEYVMALPEGATDVREFHWAEGFLPDFEYLLKARIDEADFLPYVEDLGQLELHSETREYTDDPMWLSWTTTIHFDGDWWDPSADLSGTYVYQSKHFWELVKYESGHLYVMALDH